MPPRPAPLLAVALLVLSGSPSPAAAQGEEKIKTVVVGLSARRGVDEGLALAMSDVVHGVFAKSPGRIVLGRQDIQRVLNFESERQALGCNTDSCLSELAQALDVERMITGSMDKVGSSYFVVITEIDARSVEPLGRVQGRLPLDEDALITEITALAEQLLKQSLVAGSSPSMQGKPGGLVVETDPPGALVFVAGREVGKTPVRVEALPPGTHEVILEREGFEPIRIMVPVYGEGVTEVGGQLAAPPPPSPEQLRAHEEARFWRGVWGWTKIGTSPAVLLVGGLGSLLVANWVAEAASPMEGYVMCGTCLSATALVTAAYAGWGVSDLVVELEPPTGEGPPKHRLKILPPEGKGAVQQVEATARPAEAQVPY